MRVKFLQSVAGVSWCYLPKEIHDIPDAQAEIYIEHGIAVRVTEESLEELAVLAGGEVPERPRGKRRGDEAP